MTTPIAIIIAAVIFSAVWAAVMLLRIDRIIKHEKRTQEIMKKSNEQREKLLYRLQDIGNHLWKANQISAKKAIIPEWDKERMEKELL